MTMTLPRFKYQFNLPTNRICSYNCLYCPNFIQYIRHKQIPGEKEQMSFSWSISFFLRFLPRNSTTLIDNLIGKTHRNQTRRNALFVTDKNRFLEDIEWR